MWDLRRSWPKACRAAGARTHSSSVVSLSQPLTLFVRSLLTFTFYCIGSCGGVFSLLFVRRRVGDIWRKWAYGVALRAESHDRHGWEGQAGSFQSHSRVWPLTGALHFDRGQLIHTNTSHTVSALHTGRERKCVCVHVCVELCVCVKNQLEVQEGSFLLLFSICVFVFLAERRKLFVFESSCSNM